VHHGFADKAMDRDAHIAGGRLKLSLTTQTRRHPPQVSRMPMTRTSPLPVSSFRFARRATNSFREAPPSSAPLSFTTRALMVFPLISVESLTARSRAA